jgi:hypothetical protein
LAFGAAAARGPLSPADVRSRVLARYPEALELPDHPELLRLMKEAGFDVRWEPSASGAGAYVPNTQDFTGLSSRSKSHHRHSTELGGVVEVSPEVADARRFEERIARASRDGAYLVLKVDVRLAEEAISGLCKRFPVHPVSLERLFVDRLREAAGAVGASWDVVVRADAAPAESFDQRQLRSLVQSVMPKLEADLLALEGTVLLTDPGILVRYESLGVLERLRDRLGVRTGSSSIALQGLWVIVPGDDQHETPVLDGKAIPVVTPAEWAAIPEAWVDNRHRSSVGASATPSPVPAESLS